MIKLIWTYDKDVHSYNKSDLEYEKVTKNLKNFYKRSIFDAKSYGHPTEMYSNDTEFADLVDNFIYTNYDAIFWDELKSIPLKNSYEDFVLVDGDIIFHQPFRVNSNVDVLIDHYEEFNWKILYEQDVNKLTELGIKDGIPEWDGKRRPAFGTGILSFNNKELQDIYVDRYTKFRGFVEEHKEVLNVSKCTAVGAQYLLATICNNRGYTSYAYSKTPGVSNGIYTHYAGKLKLTTSFLPLTEKHLL